MERTAPKDVKLDFCLVGFGGREWDSRFRLREIAENQSYPDDQDGELGSPANRSKTLFLRRTKLGDQQRHLGSHGESLS